MKSITLALICLWLALDNAAARRRYEDQIVGGEEAKPGEFPFLARLIVSKPGETGYCGGSILDERHILTATHCLIDGDPEKTHRLVAPSKVTVKLGCHKPDECASDKGPPLKVKRIMAYYYFGPKLNNDIALIKLTKDIKFKKKGDGRAVMPIKLAQSDPICHINIGRSGGPNPRCEMLTIMGWGDTVGKKAPQQATVLRKALIPSVPFEKCQQAYPFIKKTVMCAGDETKGACFGDSGGPLVKLEQGNFLQVGLSSFVGPDDCVHESGGGFTLVGPYHQWIQSCIKGRGCNAMLSDAGSELGTEGELSGPYPGYRWRDEANNALGCA